MLELVIEVVHDIFLFQLWMMQLRKKFEESPADLDSISELITAVLRSVYTQFSHSKHIEKKKNYKFLEVLFIIFRNVLCKVFMLFYIKARKSAIFSALL